MRAIISERLRLSLHQHGNGVLTVTLHTVRCACETTFRVSVEADAPRNPGQYASFVQDGIRIYYSPRLDHASDMLELDSSRGLFQSKPVLVGPDELLARLMTGLARHRGRGEHRHRPGRVRLPAPALQG